MGSDIQAYCMGIKTYMIINMLQPYQKTIGVGKPSGLHRVVGAVTRTLLPQIVACGFPAHGSPVDVVLIGGVSRFAWLDIRRNILGGSRTPDCKNPGMAANLIGCEYATGNKLRGKDLRGAQLIKAKLTGDLGTVNLEGANLTGGTFGVSDEKEPPSGSSLTLQGGTAGSPLANLRGANLSNSVTANGFPIHASFVEFTSANLSNIIWHGANLEGAWMSHALLIHAQILDCNCAAADMAYADLRSAVLWNAKMSGAVLYSANLSRAQLSGADVSNADFSYANMAYASLTIDTNITNLAGANFTGADLTGVNFTALCVTTDAAGWFVNHFRMHLVITGVNIDAEILPPGRIDVADGQSDLLRNIGFK